MDSFTRWTTLFLTTSLAKIVALIFLVVLGDGELHRLCGAPGQRLDPGSARTKSRRARRLVSTDRRCREIPPEGRLHPGARKQVLLLARALPRDDSRHHHARGGPFRQHAFRRPDGHRRHQRRGPLRLRDRLVRRLRHRHRRLVVELEISFPRRHSCHVADDLATSSPSASRHPGLSLARPAPANRGRPLSNRTRLDDRALHRRLDESPQMAARDPDVHLVRRLHHRDLRGDEPPAVRSCPKRRPNWSAATTPSMAR